jgi:hypothetical protein
MVTKGRKDRKILLKKLFVGQEGRCKRLEVFRDRSDGI